MDELEARLHRIGRHPFRAKFRLRGRDRAVVDLRGVTTVRGHAEELVGRRLAPAEPRNDGRQTPYRGHPVFVAQHATGDVLSHPPAALARHPRRARARRRRAQLRRGGDLPVDREPVRPPLPAAVTTMKRIATIGGYGFTAGIFLEQLTGAGVGLLLDLRQRCGVRGPDYSWANSARLQRALAAADIGYRHVKGLAPTTELRQLQYREDDRQGVGKRNRIALAPEYAARYTREILDPFDLGALVAELPSDTMTTLLCVERDPQACHRSLVAARLRAEYGLPVTALRPD